MNLIHLLEQNCGEKGEKPVFIEKGHATSYEEFYRMVAAIAGNLKDQATKPGDNVLVLMPLSVKLYAALCGVWMAGATVVLFDPSAGADHIAACLNNIPVREFVGDNWSLALRLMNRHVRRIPYHFHVDNLLTEAQKSMIQPVPPDAAALITFTSGSTGIPKAIVRTHGFLLEQHRAIVGALPYDPADVDLAVLSVFTLVNLMEGITTVLPQDSLRSIAKVNAGKLTRQIHAHGVTRITASPKLMEKLSYQALLQGKRLDSLRSVNIGGGPVFLDVLEQVARVTDPGGIRVVYGSTEAEPIAELHYPDLSDADRRRMQEGAGLLVGTPTDTIDLRIIRSRSGRPVAPEELPQLEAAGGEWGEIIVAGRHVVQGYLNPEQDAAAKISADGTVWHRTGDCGYLDAGGRLWLLGRLSQVMEDENGPVFPFAVESAIRARYRTVSALTQMDGEKVLVIEQGRHSGRIAREYAERFRVVALGRIPLDRRHSSKIDYHALHKALARKL